MSRGQQRSTGRRSSSEVRVEGASREHLVVSPAMRVLYDQAAQVADARIAVLVVGETGVGKEHVAEFLHTVSVRASEPFVRVNCAAINETLFESELFGFERGAFTGADRAKPGLLEAAGRGTVFLDEIGELPASMQAKLLRALEARAVTRVGGLDACPIEARFVSATNCELESAVEAGTFRRDLYHRIAGVRLAIPPLRERPEEIQPLADLFLRTAVNDMGLPARSLTREAREALAAHQWSGNVRELRNAIERAALFARDGFVGAEHLQLVAPEPRPSALEVTPAVPVAPTEPSVVVAGALRLDDPRARELVVSALLAAGGNQSVAARRLGIARRTLSRWLDRFGLPRPRKRPASATSEA